MKTLIFVVLFLGYTNSETSNSIEINKINPSKTTLSPAQPQTKPSSGQQYILTSQPPAPQGQHYAQVAYQQRPVQQHRPLAQMFIIAQPVAPQQNIQPQFNPNNAHFQQAVQQLLHYYENNPQARLQLLNQQHGSVFQLPGGNQQSGPSYISSSPQPTSQGTYIIPSGHQQQYIIPSGSQQQQQVPQTFVIPSGHQQAIQGRPTYSLIASGPQQGSHQPLEGMRIVPAPQLDQGHQYIPASSSNSGQHYIPAVANGQFAVGPGLYQTIPQQFYQQGGYVQQTAASNTQNGPQKVGTNSRNDLNDGEKFQQATPLTRSFYFKG